jgi:hypothetical protein
MVITGAESTTSGITDRPSARTSRVRASSAPAIVLLGGLAAGLLAQGGFYGPARLPLFGATAVAVALALVAIGPSWQDVRLFPAAAATGLAAWAVLRGIGSGEPGSGLAPALLLLAFTGVLLLVRRLDDECRRLLLAGLLGVGAVVAAVGWFAVVGHRMPWALPNDGVWRAASTLTYANATAAVLVPLSLVGVGVLAGRPRDVRLTLVTTLLLAGALATLSRAGILSLTAGAVVLAAMGGGRRIAAVALPPVLGAGIGMGGLLVAMPLTAQPYQPVALLGLPVGLAFAALLVVRPPTRRASLVLLAALSAGVVLLVGSGTIGRAMAEVAEMRANASSPARVDATRAALDIVAQRPVTGVGPGDGWVRWSSADGTARTMRYVHDEYLQVLVELGAPGLALLLGIGAGGLVMVRRASRQEAGSNLPAAVAAALAAAAVHGAFDFVWHVPVVPLVLAVLLGLVAEPCAYARPTGRGDPPER